MGDQYGKDVFKYGSDDWQARRYNEEWKAERHPAVSTSSNDWSSSNPSQNNPDTYSSRSSGGSSLGKFLLFAVAGVALMGYFGSESNKSSSPEERFRAQREAYEARSIDTTQPTTTTPAPSSSSYSAAPETTPAPQPEASTSTSRLPENDPRVTAAVNDVQAASRVTLFVAGGGDMLVVERQLPTPERNLTQTRFNVGDLDLYQATFAADNGNLNIPCKQNAACVAYNVYEGSTEQTAGALREHNTYTSVSMWSGSNDDANRILQDLLQLKNLQQ